MENKTDSDVAIHTSVRMRNEGIDLQKLERWKFSCESIHLRDDSIGQRNEKLQFLDITKLVVSENVVKFIIK